MYSSRFKKIATAFVITLLILSFSTSELFAAGSGFTDITASRYDWVRPYIEKMNLAGVVKGMTDTTYGPDASVTREQLITMLVRLMGWESQASGKTLPSNFPKASSVAPWARGYVAVAVEKGIVSGKDFEDFRPQDAAIRSEVAVFAVKALGLGQEAESRKNLSVSLTFTDGYMMEPEVRPYVEIAVEKGIMKGFPDNTFKPNDKFTRAQMATVLHNLSKLTKAHNIISGVVQDIDAELLPSVEIKFDDGTRKVYSVNLSETLIYKENESGNLAKIKLDDIKIGDYVNIIASGTSARYIDVISGSNAPITDGDAVEGTIKEINLIRSTLAIKTNDNKERIYNIKNQTKIYIDGKEATLYQLTVGQTVKLTVTGADVDKIDAKGVDKVVKGIIRSINTYTNVLTIENESTDKYESYTISSNARIYRDNRVADIYKLTIGDVATLTVSGSSVVEIEAESATKEVKGIITGFDYARKNPVIVIEDEDGEEYEYELDEDATIRKNGKKAKISDLKNGDEVTLTLEYNIVVSIAAESVKRDIRGTVKAITFADTTTVTLIDDKGKEHVITITPNTEIFKDKKRIDATELRPNYYLDMEVENDEAISIDVTVRKVQDTVRGSVVNINENVKVIVISVDGTKENQHIYYNDDTVILKDNREIRISRIEEGNEIIAIGSYDGGLFFAHTIHDITISD
ncbi:S-layer homology domain-containing protein [Tepidanaerobacter sp. GT38]|uniref:S-layer homology domain-containing protein n=1 Tax=Tepidanaerobacter sp. GT38 TaxID=2722793 RepID=UPI001F15786E|nr:S-layer homology domain-containing protein [Tepidanaerobacter sp. GT38]MCG1012603.1 S-layer homology domain-containing protein [Tepidanaerobacter sp. GT38]